MQPVLFQCLAVVLSLIVSLVMPAMVFCSIAWQQHKWADKILSAAVLCIASQCLFGFTWNYAVQSSPGVESILYLLFWLFITIFVFYSKNFFNHQKIGKKELYNNNLLILIVITAFIIRIIHPLQTYALGQSDAYSHLNFLRDIVNSGKLNNPVYPPGYHWVLALPVLFFKIDPYIVVRFAGAFFGVLLVLAVYVLVNELFDRRAALISCFLAGCFPGMNILIKTGVGSFANQLGLLLVPCIVLYYYSIIHKNNKSILLFLAASLAMASSVPIMLIHIFIIIGIERFISIAIKRTNWLNQSLLIISLCLPAIGVFGFQIYHAQGIQSKKSYNVISSYLRQNKNEIHRRGETKHFSTERQEHSSYIEGMIKLVKKNFFYKMISDFLSIKRIGFDSFIYNSLSVLLLIMFLVCAVTGYFKGEYNFIIIGIWGLVALIQTVTGIMQFTAYQREGWSLLIAVSAAAGVLLSKLYYHTKQSVITKTCIGTLSTITAIWSITHPPHHNPIGSYAENTIIQVVRTLSIHQKDLSNWCKKKNDRACGLAGKINKDIPIEILTRRITGWPDGQGELVANVLPLNSNIKYEVVGRDKLPYNLKRRRQYIVFIDRNPLDEESFYSGVSNMISPDLVKTSIQDKILSFSTNLMIENMIKNLDEKAWKVDKIHFDDQLYGYILKPITT